MERGEKNPHAKGLKLTGGQPREGGKEEQHSGTIRSASEDGVELEEEAGRTVRFAVEELIRARLDVDFGRSGGKGRQR